MHPLMAPDHKRNAAYYTQILTYPKFSTLEHIGAAAGMLGAAA